MALNEESVKAKLILPLLRSLGVTEDEIELETTISIQLGRGVYTIRGDEAERASGRLDLLCRRNGHPLFVVELKAEEEELTDEDRRQGLSYARLIEPMAPWVLVSNGRHTQIYDTVTGKQANDLEKSRLEGLSPDLDSELALRFEALDHFIGYSLNNLLAFCRTHNEGLLLKFRADSSERPEAQLQKKYLPATYIARTEIEARFEDFIAGGTVPTFAIVGESGTGKTSLICHLLEKNADKPALFYSGSLLGGSLFRELALDFNLTFSSQDPVLAVARKISALAVRYGQPFLLFLDAVDEWEAPDKAHQLSNLVRVCDRFHIKLVVSCKKAAWPMVLSRNGLPTALAEALHPDVPEILDFHRGELEAAIHSYSRLLGVPKEPASATLSLANPFALRIAFEVSYRDQVPLSSSYDSRSTFARYLDLKLGLSGNYERRFLSAISGLLLDLGKVQIFEDELRTGLTLRLAEEIPLALFVQNILYRYIDETGLASIGFYFSLIRDHMIAIHVLHLDRLQDSEKIIAVNRASASYLGQSALVYFLRTGSEQDVKSCIEALLDYSADSGGILPLLLSWYGRPLKTLEQYQSRIFNLLKSTLRANLDNLTLAEQIVEVVNLWPPSGVVELLLVDFFDILSCQPSGLARMISHRLAALLSAYRRASCTKRLIELALDSDRDGYVRRYMVVCLYSRPFKNREEAFLQLIVDPDANVRTFVRSWYSRLETEELRDKVLYIFDTSLYSHIRADLALTLALSTLNTTGKELFDRWQTGGFDEHLLSWTARSIATLNYRTAIPEFIQRFREAPYSKVSEHLLLALGELRAKEVMPVLLDLIAKGDERLDAWWVLHAVSSTAGTSDYKAIEKIAKAPLNSYARFLGVLLLADASTEGTDALVRSFIADVSMGDTRRSHVLRIWGHKMFGQGRLGARKIRKRRKRELQPVSNETIALLYQLLEEGSQLSSQALSLLVSLDTNSQRLAERIERFLPRFRVEFTGREVPYWNLENLEKLAPVIRPWLNTEISSPRLTTLHAVNCLRLLDMLGDLSSLDALNANRKHLECLVHKGLLEHVEETLRRYGGMVRQGPRH